MILVFILESRAQLLKYFEFLLVHESLLVIELQNLFLWPVNFHGVVIEGGSHCVVRFFSGLGLRGAVYFTSRKLFRVLADKGTNLIDV